MKPIQLHTYKIAAEILIAEHLPVKSGRPWKFRWHHGLKTFGTCDAFKRVITISKPLAAADTMREAMDTLAHEIAHAYADLAGEDDDHGPLWEKYCKKLNARPDASMGARGERIRKKAERIRAKNRK